MAYDTLSFDNDTGLGLPSEVRLERVSPVLINESAAGYRTTRPKHTKDHWLIKLDYLMIRPYGYIYLIDFWHDHRGGTLFYFQLHFGLYGIPEYFYASAGLSDPTSPWHTDESTGYGEAPIWLCRFNPDQQSLPIRRMQTKNNYWCTESSIEIVQV